MKVTISPGQPLSLTLNWLISPSLLIRADRLRMASSSKQRRTQLPESALQNTFVFTRRSAQVSGRTTASSTLSMRGPNAMSSEKSASSSLSRCRATRTYLNQLDSL